MKDKIKEIVLKIKLVIMLGSMLVLCVSGLVGEMWPKTEFNWPLAICAVSGIVFMIMAKIL